MMPTLPLAADLDLLALHRLAPSRYPALFESTAHGTVHGRWDLLLIADGERLRLDADGTTRDGDGVAQAGDFLAALDAAWARSRVDRSADESVPFRSGWALLLDYELAGQIEPVLQLPMRSDGAPIALALRCPAAIVRDRRDGRCLAVAEPGHEALLHRVAEDVAAAAALPAAAWQAPSRVEEDAPAHFTGNVARVLDYLRAGDVFQANISRAWEATFDAPVDPAGLFARLREANPAPFAGLFVAEGRAVVSSSPERLVSVQGDLVQTRPIAGTRPRFAGDDDARRIQELVGHPKERAEHVMLIDLARNDIGRIAKTGSVKVTEAFAVERYSHVMHIVSNVEGTLKDGMTAIDVLKATFPAGTLTGAPKVHAMELIDQLEPTKRGIYGGACGYISYAGDMDVAIAIRTGIVKDQMLHVQAAAGVVADSVPELEWKETEAKARALLRAAELVEEGLE